MEKEVLPLLSGVEVVGRFEKFDGTSLTLKIVREVTIKPDPSYARRLAEQVERLRLRPGDLVGVLSLGKELRIRKVREG